MKLDQKFDVMCRPAHGPRYCAMLFVPPKRSVVVRNAANERVSLHRVLGKISVCSRIFSLLVEICPLMKEASPGQ